MNVWVCVWECVCAVSNIKLLRPRRMLGRDESAIAAQNQPTLHYRTFTYTIYGALLPSCTLSPVFIRLLAEKSFRDFVTSLSRKTAALSTRNVIGGRNNVENKKREWFRAGSYSLRHLSNVFVPQRHPQVVVLMQQHLFLPGISHSTGFIPAIQRPHCPSSRHHQEEQQDSGLYS